MENEKKNLIQLLEKFEIRIPILQRDYAQGRDTAEKIREHLLNDIYQNITKANPSYDLNFIYGNSKDTIFYPVDGQQRLTSLYLIYWFLQKSIEKQEGRWPEDFGGAQIPQITELNKFTYMTRTSSIDFFEFLRTAESIKLYDALISKTCSIPEVYNNAWFKISWKNDPTIEGAIKFLIAVACNNEKRTFNNSGNRKGLYKGMNGVTFSFLNNKDEKAEETAAKIYLRMNNRGKKLTEFENLKAILDKLVELYSVDEEDDFVKKFNAKYENGLFDLFSETQLISETQFVEKTREMDNYCYRMVCLMYNVAFRETMAIHNCVDVVEKIYELSQSKNDDAEEDVKAFFVFLTNYFTYITELRKKLWKEGYLKEQIDYKPSDMTINLDKAIAASILYINAYVNAQKNGASGVPSDVGYDLENFEKVLKWISFGENLTDNYWDITNEWVEGIAVAQGVKSYFSNLQKNGGTVREYLVGKNPNIGCAMECLRCIAEDYFDAEPSLEYEGRKSDLPFVLYMAGVYVNSTANIVPYNAQMLKRYFDIYDYFKGNDYKWRSSYAMASVRLINPISDQSINRFVEKNGHWWDVSWKGWSKVGPDTPDVPNRTGKLAIAKTVYDSINNATNASADIDQKVKAFIQNEISKIPPNIWEITWLNYMINLDYPEVEKSLLKYKVSLDTHSNRLEIDRYGKFSVVAIGKMLAGKVFTEFETLDKRFPSFAIKGEDSYCWQNSISIVAESEEKTYTFKSGCSYRDTNNKYYHRSDKNYTMKMKYQLIFTIVEKKLFSVISQQNAAFKIFCVNWRDDKIRFVYGNDTLGSVELYLGEIDSTTFRQEMEEKVKSAEEVFDTIIQDAENESNPNYDYVLGIKDKNELVTGDGEKTTTIKFEQYIHTRTWKVQDFISMPQDIQFSYTKL